MATKKICDVCGKDAHKCAWVWDGGYQRDPASGRTEETGNNFDFCLDCYLSIFVKTLKSMGDEAEKVFSRIASEKVKMNLKWK